jgi:hypothetical protein
VRVRPGLGFDCRPYRIPARPRACCAISTIGFPDPIAARHAGIGSILALNRIHRPRRDSQAVSVAPEVIRRIIDALIGRGCTFVTMSGMLELPGQTSVGRTACLAFGFVDTDTSALPICREYRGAIPSARFQVW